MTETSFVRVGWLIDGAGGPVQENVVLKIQNGYIESVDPAYQDTTLNDRAVVDLSYCTILPPLVDCHVHLFMSAATDEQVRRKQLSAGYRELKPVIREHLHHLFSHGVLGVRDGGDRGGFVLRFRSENEMHPLVNLAVSGRAWHREKRYGALIGRSNGAERLAKAYLENVEPVEFVKLVNSGLNSLMVFGKETSSQFTAEEITELVAAAAANNQKVMVHANGREPVRTAVEAGCCSIEHGFFMGKENLRRMADRNTFWCPTVFTMKAYGTNLAPGAQNVDHRVIAGNMEHQLEQLAYARELGVQVAMGTDAGSLGVLHGESMVEEMKLFKKAGYSLVEIIRSATSVGASLLGIDSFGELVKGKHASFLVCRGTPAQLPRKLSYLEDIYIDGVSCEMYRKNPYKNVVAK
ncbi:amidohydrolase family protein [Desulforhopalus singaporensis]|uniref:Imidazolonepropionase n=1 Tax=Desulforhopalus singaporensis TaxID=91360 RepID=A0A1H0TZZ2_9BACT|nr:amidohydrolase family protein [Desulforhopalus singaporensis]SDP59461.1 Imidazolonepropionase [Desulforhopalus singaporensis]